MTNNLIITIGRQYGSGGREIGEKLAQKLGIAFYNNELITMAANKSGMAHNVVGEADEKATNSLLYTLAMGSSFFNGNAGIAFDMPLNDKLFVTQSDIIKDLAEKSPAVFIGRCADYVLREREDVLSVFVHAPLEARVKRICDLRGISRQEAEKLIIRSDRKRANYYQHYTDWTWGAASTYHLSIDSSLTGIDGGVVMIETMLRLNGLL